MKPLANYILEASNGPTIRECNDVAQLLKNFKIWTNDAGESILFVTKNPKMAYSDLRPFQRGCSMILLVKNPKKDGYIWVTITPQQATLNAFSKIVPCFHGVLKDTIEGNSTLSFPQRGPVTNENEYPYTVEVYTFRPEDLDMKSLEKCARNVKTYMIPKIGGAITGIVGKDRPLFWEPKKKYIG